MKIYIKAVVGSLITLAAASTFAASASVAVSPDSASAVVAKHAGRTDAYHASREVLLAGGDTLQVTTVHGIIASDNANNPPPLLLKLSNPGAIVFKGKAAASCEVLASTVEDVKAKRVYVRTNWLSCEDATGKSVTYSPMEGYLVGGDNMLGLQTEGEIQPNTAATLVVTSTVTNDVGNENLKHRLFDVVKR